MPIITGEGDARRRSEQFQKEWIAADRKAKVDLILSISSLELKQFRECATSNDVWKKLESVYASKGPAKKAALLNQVTLCKMAEGMDVRTHLTEFYDAVDKLHAMNVEINGDLLTVLILNSLPASFETFRIAMQSRDDLPDPDSLRVKIIELDDARKQKEKGNGDGAMFVKYGPFRGQSRKEHGNIGKAVSPKTNVAEQAFITECLHSSADSAIVPKWFLDSGCTSHLCNDKSLFIESEETHSGLKLASDAMTRVTGRDSQKRTILIADREGDLFFIRQNLQQACATSSATDRTQDNRTVVEDVEDNRIATSQTNEVRNASENEGELSSNKVSQDTNHGRDRGSVDDDEELEWHDAGFAMSESEIPCVQALNGPDADKWKEAIYTETKNLVASDTWMLLRTSKGQACSERIHAETWDRFSRYLRAGALSVELDLHISQLDITAAYLNGDIDTDVYMRILDFLDEMMKEIIRREGDQIIANKARMIQQCLSSGSLSTNADPCLYTDKKGQGTTIALVYVDDILIASNNKSRVNEIKVELSRRFLTRDLGTRESLTLSQESYIKDVLNRFHMEDCNPVKTPLAVGAKLEEESEGNNGDPELPYRELIGALMYIALGTRPDISHAVSVLSSAITWESRKQRTTVLSSTEAEYMAVSDAAKGVYLLGFLKELGLQNFAQLRLYNDNQGAQKLARNPLFHARIKHIDVRHHFIRQVL
nr:PREDICTED: uncharacterized protein LOC105664311 [Megachile rotundata]